MYKGKIKGFLADGQNPAVGGPNAKLARAAMRQAGLAGGEGHLHHRDRGVLEGARASTAKDIKTEVFFLPAAPAAEKDGSLTNTMRLHPVAREGGRTRPATSRSDAEFFVSLAKRLQKLYAGSKKERDKGFLAASFEYGDRSQRARTWSWS